MALIGMPPAKRTTILATAALIAGAIVVGAPQAAKSAQGGAMSAAPAGPAAAATPAASATPANLAASANAAAPGTVIVELFTAQGCSSCPPADRLLARIGQDPKLGGAKVIPLGFHVDYWNRQGWFDPFSSEVWTKRQATYDKALFHSDNVYTPQLVINGRTECVGSKEPEVTNLITTALATPPAGEVSLSAPEKPLPATGGGSSRIVVTARMLRPAAHGLDVWVALTENNLTTAVRSGENASQTLRDDHVVRRLVKAFSLKETAGSEHSGKVDLAIDPTWKGPFEVVAFLQDPKTLNIEGATERPLTR